MKEETCALLGLDCEKCKSKTLVTQATSTQVTCIFCGNRNNGVEHEVKKYAMHKVHDFLKETEISAPNPQLKNRLLSFFAQNNKEQTNKQVRRIFTITCAHCNAQALAREGKNEGVKKQVCPACGKPVAYLNHIISHNSLAQIQAYFRKNNAGLTDAQKRTFIFFFWDKTEERTEKSLV